MFDQDCDGHDEDESTPTLAETPVAKRTISQQVRAAERPTTPVPADPPANDFARAPCGVPGFEQYTARGYALFVAACVREGNFGHAEELIRKAREACMLGIIRAAWTGSP
jgi:hypothetical protein